MVRRVLILIKVTLIIFVISVIFSFFIGENINDQIADKIFFAFAFAVVWTILDYLNIIKIKV